MGSSALEFRHLCDRRRLNFQPLPSAGRLPPGLAGLESLHLCLVRVVVLGLCSPLRSHLRGAAVTANYLRSKADAEMILQQVREAGGDFTLTQGDVGNAEDCVRMASEFTRAHPPLNLLIHNAFPPIQAHTFIEQGHEEFLRFIGRALGYVITSSEAFLPIMAEGGIVVVISSAYVTTPRPLFPIT